MSVWTLQALTEPSRVIGRLCEAGFSADSAVPAAQRFTLAAQVALDEGASPDDSAMACFVPGRIEVLGKHTDYAGGRSLIAAAERGFCGIALPHDDVSVHITDARRTQHCRFTLSPSLMPTPGEWSNYPMTVARRMARNFPDGLHGARIVFASDLEPAAGMSSSSALIVLMFLLLAERNAIASRPEFQQNILTLEDLAGYLGTIENGQSFRALEGDRGVGTFGGSEDHTAILCSRPGQLAQFSYCPVKRERTIVVPDDYVFGIAVCGVVAEKTGSAMEKYNRASRRAAAVLEIWRAATHRADPHLAAVVASSEDAAERVRECLRQARHAEFSRSELLDRFEQFLAESTEIIPSVGDRLEGDALAAFGQLVDRSQSLGARLLGNQVPQTIHLAETAGRLGAVAASAFGAGFGGSTWALVRAEDSEEFLRHWADEYARAFPADAGQAQFFTTRPGPPATFLGESTPTGRLALPAA